jgi:hypothetical protein
MDVHRDFVQVAICQPGQVVQAGAFASTLRRRVHSNMPRELVVHVLVIKTYRSWPGCALCPT